MIHHRPKSDSVDGVEPPTNPQWMFSVNKKINCSSVKPLRFGDGSLAQITLAHPDYIEIGTRSRMLL